MLKPASPAAAAVTPAEVPAGGLLGVDQLAGVDDAAHRARSLRTTRRARVDGAVRTDDLVSQECSTWWW